MFPAGCARPGPSNAQPLPTAGIVSGGRSDPPSSIRQVLSAGRLAKPPRQAPPPLNLSTPPPPRAVPAPTCPTINQKRAHAAGGLTCGSLAPVVTAGAHCAPLSAGSSCTHCVPAGSGPVGVRTLPALRSCAIRDRSAGRARQGGCKPRPIDPLLPKAAHDQRHAHQRKRRSRVSENSEVRVSDQGTPTRRGRHGTATVTPLSYCLEQPGNWLSQPGPAPPVATTTGVHPAGALVPSVSARSIKGTASANPGPACLARAGGRAGLRRQGR